MEKRDKRQKIRTVLILEVLLFFSGLLILQPVCLRGSLFGLRNLLRMWAAIRYSSILCTIILWSTTYGMETSASGIFNNGFGVNMFQMNLFDPTLILLYLIGLIRGATIWGSSGLCADFEDSDGGAGQLSLSFRV